MVECEGVNETVKKMSGLRNRCERIVELLSRTQETLINVGGHQPQTNDDNTLCEEPGCILDILTNQLGYIECRAQYNCNLAEDIAERL